MLKMSQEEARRERRSRVSRLRAADSETYNTGAAVVVGDAPEYILGYLRDTRSPYVHGQAPYTDRQISSGTGGTGSVLIFGVRGSTASPSPIMLNPAAVLHAVRSIFHLTISQTAEVFRVSRPTIYQWQTLEDDKNIRAQKDCNRMRNLYDLANKWKMLGPLTGRWLTTPIQDNKSVFEMLCEDQPNEVALHNAHAQLLAASVRLKEAENRKSIEAVKALDDPFAKLDKAAKRRAKR